MKTLTYSTLAASTTPCAQRATASMWAVPVQGTSVSLPAFQLGQIVGLGATLMTKDGGQIFGFDIDQNGNDGVLAVARGGDPQGDAGA